MYSSVYLYSMVGNVGMLVLTLDLKNEFRGKLEKEWCQLQEPRLLVFVPAWRRRFEALSCPALSYPVRVVGCR